MSRLTRYILSEISLPLIFGIFAFSFIIFGTTVMVGVVRDAVEYSIPVLDVVYILLFQLPYVLNISLPMGMLFASLITFFRLNADSEIIALRASGVSLSELIKPLIIIGLLTSIFGILMSEFIVPKSMTLSSSIVAKHQFLQSPKLKKNINFTEFDKGICKRIVNIIEIKDSKLKDITIAEFKAGYLSSIMKAKTGRWDEQEGWQFFDGVIHYVSQKQPLQVMSVTFDIQKVNFKVSPLDFIKRKRQVIELTASELKERIKEKKILGLDVRRDIMDYHIKFALSFACLIYALLGLPLGVRPQRSSSAMGIGITLITIFIYYMLISIGFALGQSNYLHPIVAIWFPNLVIGAVSFILLSRAVKQ